MFNSDNAGDSLLHLCVSLNLVAPCFNSGANLFTESGRVQDEHILNLYPMRSKGGKAESTDRFSCALLSDIISSLV